MTGLCIKAPYLFVVTVDVSILHLLGLPILTPFSPPMLLVSGQKFWELCVYDNTLERRLDSLRDGDQSDLSPSGVSMLLSPSLASSSSSLRSVYEAWKAGTLTRAMLADISTSESISAYFSASPGLSSTSSLRSNLCVLSGIVRCACSLDFACQVNALSLTFEKAPVHLRLRGHGSSLVVGASPGSLSVRCVAFTVSLVQ